MSRAGIPQVRNSMLDDERKQKCSSRVSVEIGRTGRPIALLWIVAEVRRKG